jgi:hypothetical protein
VRDSGGTAKSELNLGEIEGDEAVAAGGGGRERGSSRRVVMIWLRSRSVRGTLVRSVRRGRGNND